MDTQICVAAVKVNVSSPLGSCGLRSALSESGGMQLPFGISELWAVPGREDEKKAKLWVSQPHIRLSWILLNFFS